MLNAPLGMNGLISTRFVLFWANRVIDKANVICLCWCIHSPQEIGLESFWIKNSRKDFVTAHKFVNTQYRQWLWVTIHLSTHNTVVVTKNECGNSLRKENLPQERCFLLEYLFSSSFSSYFFELFFHECSSLVSQTSSGTVFIK